MNNQTVVLPYVQVSRFAKFMRDKTAILADDIACLLSDKETGIRDKFLLFFTSICNVPVRKSANIFGLTARDLKKSKQNWSANKRVWQLGFMRSGGVKLHSTYVREAYPALARLSGSMQPCLRTLQQKF